MSAFVGSLLKIIHKRFNLHHNNLIHIEGGLGSQILGAILFWNLKEKLGEKRAKCDLSYFSDEAQSNGLWAYELERYNLPLTVFKEFERVGKRNLIKAKKDFLSDEELNDNYWEESRTKYKGKFDFDLHKVMDYFQEKIGIDLNEAFAAIHIRRGDYLLVASRIVRLDEYLQLIESVKKTFPNRVIFISDSEIENEARSSLQALLENHELIYLDAPGLDSFNIHCLLREAEVLVTANSTYSFSAGLLGRQGQTVFSPLQFHSGEGLEKYNRTFRAAGTFFVWPTRS